MKRKLTLMVAGSLLSFTAFAGQGSCVGSYASLPIEADSGKIPVATVQAPSAPTAPEVTEGKILLAGDAPCNPKVTVCEE